MTDTTSINTDKIYTSPLWQDNSFSIPSFNNIGLNSTDFMSSNLLPASLSNNFMPAVNNGNLSNQTIFNQSDFMSMTSFPPDIANTYLGNMPLPALFPMFPMSNIPSGTTSSSSLSSFSKKSFTQRENQLINEMAQRLNCNPNDLKAIMYSESGCNTAKVNPNGGATGLIQFMPSTARRLGTTTQQLRNMNFEQQLVYVEKYINMARKNARIPQVKKLDAGTLYSLIFLPAFANRETLCSAGSTYYEANRVLDTNHDGHITKADLANRLSAYA
ncbi:MAG TPA: transglycosylase SLT domain-containing protein [Candidatus Gastranaerophilaceae bacterium]|nr:transglycosylase SLT domain-containing protein [Candidatus Gastranaerophilaceae bacterium]